MRAFDVAVVGAGIAGASAAYELAVDRTVVLLEAESSAGYHATGRSAATLALAYGPPAVRALTRASLPLFEDPPFDVDGPLLRARPCVWFGSPEAVDGALERSDGTVRRLDASELRETVPLLRPDVPAAAVDDSGRDIDVHALHQGYLRAFRQRGGTVQLAAPARTLVREGGAWVIGIADGEELHAEVVVDAAGAWCDEVAVAAGVAPIGLEVLLRTAFTAPSHDCPPAADGPLVAALDHGFYVKPEGERYLCSPVDATPSPPCDAGPDELAIARALDDIERCTRLGLGHVSTSWAGLRTFSPDGLPVVGRAPDVEGFVWLAGQGGFGIQTAPALARIAAAAVAGTSPEVHLSPNRFVGVER